VKDLGVFLTADMIHPRHRREEYSKANKILGMIGRTIAVRSRAVLKFCIPLQALDITWSIAIPYYLDKKLLEHVQHCFNKMVSGLRADLLELPYFL